MVTVDGGELGKMMGSKAELLTQTLPILAAVFLSMVIVLGKNPDVVGCQIHLASSKHFNHCLPSLK